jgi:uncharacterized membrane protein (DUF373 family)
MKSVKETLNKFSRGIILTLIILMMAVVMVSTVELAVVIVREIIKSPYFELQIDQLFTIFGFFMMILIGLELLESIRTYLTDEILHVEVVFLVAMIAIARKIIILDVKSLDPLALIGVASITLSLAVGFYFVKKATQPH